jgi:exopolyphosphatase/pppGpp-phosphohydrolase
VTCSKKAVKNSRRRRSLPAGILILDALRSAIDAPLTIAAGGLREGVLLDLSEPGRRHSAGSSSLGLSADSASALPRSRRRSGIERPDRNRTLFPALSGG